METFGKLAIDSDLLSSVVLRESINEVTFAPRCITQSCQFTCPVLNAVRCVSSIPFILKRLFVKLSVININVVLASVNKLGIRELLTFSIQLFSGFQAIIERINRFIFCYEFRCLEFLFVQLIILTTIVELLPTQFYLNKDDNKF